MLVVSGDTSDMQSVIPSRHEHDSSLSWRCTMWKYGSTCGPSGLINPTTWGPCEWALLNQHTWLMVFNYVRERNDGRHAPYPLFRITVLWPGCSGMPVNRLTLKNWHRSGWNVADIYAAPADNCLAHVASPAEVAVSSGRVQHGRTHTQTYSSKLELESELELELESETESDICYQPWLCVGVCLACRF